MRSNSIGFTIIELLIASTLSSIIILLGAALFVDSQKKEQLVRQSANISWSTTAVSRVLGNLFREAGGASTRPWNSVRVEDNCGPWTELGLPDCAGSDRVTLASELTMATGDFYPKITVDSYNAGTGIVGIIAIDVNANGSIDLSECALDSSMVGFVSILVNASDTVVRNLRILTVNTTDCSMTTEPEIQGQVLNQGNIGAETFLNGTISLVKLRTIYLDPATKTLNQIRKIANVSALDSADLHIYSASIYDLQFGLGYDVGFRNYSILINGSATDEVLFNATGDSMGTLGGTGGAKTDLKMLFVAITAGTSEYNKRDLGNSVRILNGANKTFPSIYLFGVERRFYLRNVLDFL